MNLQRNLTSSDKPASMIQEESSKDKLSLSSIIDEQMKDREEGNSLTDSEPKIYIS